MLDKSASETRIRRRYIRWIKAFYRQSENNLTGESPQGLFQDETPRTKAREGYIYKASDQNTGIHNYIQPGKDEATSLFGS